MLTNRPRIAQFTVVLTALAIPAMAWADRGRGGMGRPTEGGKPQHHHHHGQWWPWGWGWNWGVDVVVPVEMPRDDTALIQSAMTQERLAAMQRELEALRKAQAEGAKQQQPNEKQTQQNQMPKQLPKAVPEIQKPIERPAAPAVALTPEELGARKFKLAMLLADEGKTADAADYCGQILRKYPNTPAAEQAQDYLDKRDKR